MTKHEATILKANILGGMNEYVINKISDENAIDSWITYGLPDECDEETLMEIAEDDKAFREICITFSIILNEWDK